MNVTDFVLEKDKQASRVLTRFRNNVLDSVFEAYTSLGSVPFTILLALLILISGNKALFTELVIVLAVALPITEVVKRIVNRERPQSKEDDVYTFRNLSFPSGHAANAFATAVVLTGFGSLGYIPLLLAGIVAFSRVYLGTHYLSDVLAGSTIGIVIASVL